MSEMANKAVFLSYASQDSEAAKRICDALRQAGVEVWFDQSELVGGDAWDTKIRKQIKDCALFVPIITPNTNARAEGYFRLEWKLAVDRSHLMADDAPFLFPIVLGDVNDTTARVPDKFRDVQWTRLRLDETPGELAARVARLLSEDAVTSLGDTRGRAPGAPRRKEKSGFEKWWWLIFPIMGMSVPIIGLFKGRPVREPAARPAAVSYPDPKAQSPDPKLSEARRLAKRALAMIEAIDSGADDFAAAETLIKRAIELDATDGFVWAVSSRINSGYLGRGFERGNARREAARSQAEKAVKLAPDSPEAWLALGRGIHATDTARAEEAYRHGLTLAPQDGRMLLGLGSLNRTQGRMDEALVFYEQAAARPETRALGFHDQYLVHFYSRRYAEADRCLREAIRESNSSNMVAGQAMLEVTWHGDTHEAWKILNQAPAAMRGQPRVVLVTALIALMARQPEEALRALDRLPADYINDAWFTGPKALLAGLAHRQADRPEAARIAWNSGITVVRRRLEEMPNDPESHMRLGELLAWTGQVDAALQEARAFNELMRSRETDWTHSTVRIHAALGQADEALPLLEKLLTDLPTHSSRWPLSPALLRLDPLWDKLRDDPRFQKLCEEPAAQTAAPSAKVADKSIAVLPFTNMSEDKDANAFFADGMHEDILTHLARIRELRVVSRTSVMDYRGTAKKIPQIARELNVTYVLEGSVRRAGHKVRVTGQLIRAATDEPVWARSFDRDLTDVFAIQAELAQAIAGELDATLSPQEQKIITHRPTDNPAAYDLLLKARQLINNNQSTRDDMQKMVSMLESVVELDPKFAGAWGELGAAHARMMAASVDTTPARLARAKTAIDRALAIAPDSPDVLRSLGIYYLFGLRDVGRANEQFVELVQRQPNDGESRFWLGLGQELSGRWPEALASQRRATQLDPANVLYAKTLARTLGRVRRHDEAIAELRRIMVLRPAQEQESYLRDIAVETMITTGSRKELEELAARLADRDPASPVLIEIRKAQALREENYAEFFRLDRLQPTRILPGTYDGAVLGAINAGMVYVKLGDREGARTRLGHWPATLRAQIELEPDNTQCLRSLALVEAVLGRYDEALHCIARAEEVLPEAQDSGIGASYRHIKATIYALAGDKDRALAELAELLRRPSMWGVDMMRRDKRFANLHGDPRFEALLNDPKNKAPLY